MPTQNCHACRHSASEEIDKALRAGETIAAVAERFGLKPTGVWRHKTRHMIAKTSGGAITSELSAMGEATPRERLELLLKAALSTLEKSMKSGNSSSANQATGQIRGILTQLNEAQAEERKHGKVNPHDLIVHFLGFVPEDVLEQIRANQIKPELPGRKTVEAMRQYLDSLLTNPLNWSNDRLVEWDA
jgi:transposase-like protein